MMADGCASMGLILLLLQGRAMRGVGVDSEWECCGMIGSGGGQG